MKIHFLFKTFILSGLFSLYLLIDHSFSFAIVRIPLYGLANQATSTSSGSQTQGKFAYGGGLGLQISKGFMSTLEIDMLYLPRKTTSQVNYLAFPILYRLGLGRLISLGVGPYYATALSSGAKSDYGVLGALGFRTPFHVLLEGRYQYGIRTAPQYQDLQILVGISLGPPLGK